MSTQDTSGSPAPSGGKKRSLKGVLILLGIIVLFFGGVVVVGLIRERINHGSLEDVKAEVAKEAEELEKEAEATPADEPAPLGDGSAIQDPSSYDPIAGEQAAEVAEALKIMGQLLGNDHPVVEKLTAADVYRWKLTHVVSGFDGKSGPVYSATYDGKLVLAPLLFSDRQVGRRALLLARLYQEGYWLLEYKAQQEEHKRVIVPIGDFRDYPVVLSIMLLEELDGADGVKFRWKADNADTRRMLRESLTN